jgi:ATP-dependent Clp protease ATP-binding subunit ClpC
VRQRIRTSSCSSRLVKAFQLANQEAHRFNHSQVGAEHLVLGLAKEGLSPAARLLRQVGYNLQWLRQQLRSLQAPGPGESALPGALPYTEELQDLIQDTEVAAEHCDLLPLTPECLLLALINQSDTAIEMLGRRKLRLWYLRRRLRNYVISACHHWRDP